MARTLGDTGPDRARGSDSLPRYTFGHLAAAVAGTVPSGTYVIVLCHSLGGVVALALASGWFGVEVSAVCGLLE